MYEKLTDNLNQ